MSKLDSLVALPFAVIPAEEVVPLWPGWIPRRHVTLVVAPGGTSKGIWSVDVVARVTTGRPWPGEPQDAVREPEAVIMVAAEDDPNEAVAWRLKAAGADTSLVFNLTVLPDGSPFMMSDLDTLTEAVRQVEELTGRTVGLVTLDPLLALVGVKLPGRKEIAPAESWARKNGPAVIVCHHTVKSGKVAGMMELTNAVRHVLRIDRPAGAEKDTPVRVISVEKSNIAATDATLRYALVGDGDNCHVYYSGDVMPGAPVAADQPSTNRGYTVDPGLYSYSPSTSPASTTSWQVLRCEKDSKPEKLGDGFTSEFEARTFANQTAGMMLTWTPGDHGSVFAAVIPSGSTKPVAYTVFPNASEG